MVTRPRNGPRTAGPGAGRRLHLRGAWGDPEGVPQLVRAEAEGPVATLADAEALGQRVAEALGAGGAH